MWSAPTGSAVSDLSVEPSAPWVLVGTRGGSSISEDGIEINLTETIESQRNLASTGVENLFRPEQDLLISVGLLDLSVETFADAMGGQTPVTVLPTNTTAGYVETQLLRPGLGNDFEVNLRAFLLRTPSPYGDDMVAQFWVPRGYASLSGSIHYQKGEAAELEIEILAVLDSTDGYGTYRAQNAHPTP